MNGNDLMNALSGLDPKYIEEAAFELHESPAQQKKAKIRRFRRNLAIALPIAAAVLITIMVAVPFLKTGNSSTSPAASDTAAYAPAADNEAAAEAPAEDAYEASEAAADTAPAYEATEAAAEEAETDTSAYGGDDTLNFAPSGFSEEIRDKDEMEKAESSGEPAAQELPLGLKNPAYESGILTIETGPLPAGFENYEYSVTGTDEEGSDITFAEGILKDIVILEEPLTLDLTEFDLPEGTYILTAAGETVEFTVGS